MGRITLPDKAAYGLEGDERIAEVAVEELFDPYEIADGPGLIEAQIRLHLMQGIHADRRFGSHHGRHRVARHEIREDEDDERYAQEQGYCYEYPPDYVLSP